MSPQGQALGRGSNPFSWGNYQISGGLPNQGATLVDGASVNTTYINMTALLPTQDAVQEFQVQTNNLSPEFGGTANGVVNIATKSGSNEFHGTAYEFLRNRSLNANTFFGNLAGLPAAGLNPESVWRHPGRAGEEGQVVLLWDVRRFPSAQCGHQHQQRADRAAARGDFSNISDPRTAAAR